MLLNNERGNVTFATLYMLMFIIVGSFILLQLYGVYISRRQAQNIADSAALAAVQELRNKYEQEMQSRVSVALSDFWTEVSDYQNSFEEDPPSTEEVVRSWISDTTLQDQLLGYASLDWARVVNENWFKNRGYFGPQRNGDILYEVCLSNSTSIKNTAKTLIEKNRGKGNDFSIQFPAEQEPKILLTAKKTFKIGMETIINFQSQDDVPATSAAGIDAPFPIDVANKVEFNLN